MLRGIKAMMPVKKPYKIGLALSGGGAKGFGHLGILQALNERGIFPDVIAGTSAGAFAGVLYADGNDPENILTFFKKKTFSEFAKLTIPQGGFLNTLPFRAFLEKHLKARTYEDLKIPLYVAATDIERGKSKIFHSGELIPSIVASCSVPIIFSPVEIDKHYYVDGGLFRNLPVTPIRKLCEKVIAVNVSPIAYSEFKPAIKYVAERTIHYMSASNTLYDRDLCDYLLESNELSDYTLFDLEHSKEIFQKGYEVAINYMEHEKDHFKKDFPSFH
ncbi:patatin-like phospholipase family protein [Parabacteroides sp. Marseille-P3160]|uniref:patatin-like phospholipase family protein n=1 Tax=Parabacteroides sp. Marseille-P3160 TaxID=1917887 RepID=UPI00190EEDBD|nr:patatin-like phospholipase family protein [Parabacteroides sp. Marseille-P3160]